MKERFNLRKNDYDELVSGKEIEVTVKTNKKWERIEVGEPVLVTKGYPHLFDLDRITDGKVTYKENLNGKIKFRLCLE